MKEIKLSSISFFCPAYNDQDNLPDLIPAVVNFLEKHSEKYEITIIEDGSPDRTKEVAEELAKNFKNIKVVHHSVNKGYTATLKEGFENARYEYVMYTDGDNQYDIFDFEPYLYMLENHDALVGYATKKAVSNFRKFQSWVFNALISVLFITLSKDINCAMKIFKKTVLNNIKINSSPKGAFIDAELVLKAKKLGYKIAQFPVTHYERKSGIASGSKPELVLNTMKDMIKLRLKFI